MIYSKRHSQFGTCTADFTNDMSIYPVKWMPRQTFWMWSPADEARTAARLKNIGISHIFLTEDAGDFDYESVLQELQEDYDAFDKGRLVPPGVSYKVFD